MQEMYLQPVGVPGPAVGLWNQSQLDRIKQGNPALNGTAFVLPSAGRPFWVTATTLVGPSDHLPVSFHNSSFVQLTSTPLYVGQSPRRPSPPAAPGWHRGNAASSGVRTAVCRGALAPARQRTRWVGGGVVAVRVVYVVYVVYWCGEGAK